MTDRDTPTGEGPAELTAPLGAVIVEPLSPSVSAGFIEELRLDGASKDFIEAIERDNEDRIAAGQTPQRNAA